MNVAPSASITILLAEDDDGHATLVTKNLARVGLLNPVVRVVDGQEALDYIRGEGRFAGQPHIDNLLLVLDMNMPRVDGLEVLRQLKSDPQTSRIPVLVLTTTDDPREIERCYELGCNVYIAKPVEYDEFVESIRRLGLFLQIVKLPEMAQAQRQARDDTRDPLQQASG